MKQFVAAHDLDNQVAGHGFNEQEAIVDEVQDEIAEGDRDGAVSAQSPPSLLPTKRPLSKQGNALRAKKAKKDPYSVENVLQNPESPLVYTDLKAVLSNPEAWVALDEDDRRVLLSKLPDNKFMVEDENGAERISADFLKYNPDWTHSVGRAQEDIAEGRNDPEFLRQALEANQRREAGEFDDWKDREFELFWGTKQKLPSNVLTGQASYLALKDLVSHGLIKVGDIFHYERNVKGEHVDKEIKVISIVNSKDGKTLICHFPYGKQKFLKSNGEDITYDVTSPTSVEKQACKLHGNLTPPNGNAWKTIRVIRNNQDLGTLYDIRQALHFSIGED